MSVFDRYFDRSSQERAEANRLLRDVGAAYRPARELSASVRAAMDRGDHDELVELGRNGGQVSGYRRRQRMLVRDRQIHEALARGRTQASIAARHELAQSTVSYISRRDVACIGAEHRLLLRRRVARRFRPHRPGAISMKPSPFRSTTEKPRKRSGSGTHPPPLGERIFVLEAVALADWVIEQEQPRPATRRHRPDLSNGWLREQRAIEQRRKGWRT